MNLILIVSTFIVAGGGQPGSGPWYQKKADEAIALAQKGMKAESLRLITEMKQFADSQGSDLWKTYVTRKKGSCEYFLGDLRQAIATWKEIENNEKFPQRHNVLRDLGDAYLDSGEVETAAAYLTKAVKQNAQAAKAYQFQAPELVSIDLKQVQCKIGLSKITEARQALSAVRTALDNIKATTEPEVWVCLDARWTMLKAADDLDSRNPLRALTRLDKSQKGLQKFPFSNEALDLRFKCHIGLAADYWLVARFTDADLQLTLAEKLLPAVKTERNLATLKNARAALLIERTALALEGDFQAKELLDDLHQAQNNLEGAFVHLKNAGSGADFLSATIDFQLSQVHELRGRLLDDQGKRSDAKTEYLVARDRCESALSWRKSKFKEDHDLVLEAETRHAWLNLRLGNPREAQQEGTRTLKLFDGSHKKNDLDRTRYLHVLFEAEHRVGNTAAAFKYAEEQRRLVDDGLATMVAGLSASEQIAFFRKWDTPALNASLRMAIQHTDDPKFSAASIEWLINGKAKLAEVLATQVKAVKRASRQDFVKYQHAIERQVSLMYGEPTSDEGSRRRDFLYEEATKRELAEAAAQKPDAPRWYTLADLRSNLRDDEIYVGIYCLRPREGAKRVYQAWLVTRQGAVQSVELGDARGIEDLVHIFAREQERIPTIAPGEEKRAEQQLRKYCLDELSQRILHPVLKLADGKKRLIVSPDGPLWNIPWAALLLPDQRYAIEELTFRYAISGQDLVPGREPAARGEPLVLGDPFFNFPGTDRERLRKPGLDPLRLPWDRLEFSRRECEMVLAIMENSQLKPNRMLGAVQKGRLLDLPRPPQMVYLSTHAYATLPSKVNVDDPLLSCGLAFAGWNYLPRSGDPALPGMMTGAEVLGIDLQGTELVVLASCEAGRDELTYGQSPANLRHAFHLAGARAVVSALWGINDKSTLELMEPFMEAACRPNADKVAALRDAQQQSIRYLRMYRDHAHPFYWAGFAISGS